MPKGTNQKLKLYRLAQIMLENTDDEHYITMPEIMEELGKYEVTADRKTIYADLRDLSVLGIEVEGEPIGNRYHYRVVNRPFELPELKLLVDSIQMRDYKVVQALLLFFATEYILINLIVDVLYGVINPRVRYE